MQTSNQITCIRLDPATRKKLLRNAAKNHRTLSQEVRAIICSHFDFPSHGAAGTKANNANQ